MNTTEKPNTQKMDLTVVFWDISGFSKLCDSLYASQIPDSIVEFLKEFYEKVRTVALKYGGEVGKFMGDGVMALFGLNYRGDKDIGTSSHVDGALNAAMELRDTFKQLMKPTWDKKWKANINQSTDIGLKCGINTGDVIVAEVGADGRQYIGPTVNYASRFANLAKGNDIVMSQITYTRKSTAKIMAHAEGVEGLQNKSKKSFGDIEKCYVNKGDHSSTEAQQFF